MSSVHTERRTQAERRTVTRAKVLTATIDCLVEHGYANTSTRHIAKRAGMTVGALQHHFASKADLMAAALQTLGDRMADEFIAEAPTASASRSCSTVCGRSIAARSSTPDWSFGWRHVRMPN
jgi:AcrR family transcriptional regulator